MTDALGNALGNSIVRAGSKQPEVGGGDKGGQNSAPIDPDTGGYSPVAGFDPQQAYLQQQQKNAAVQAADNLSAQVTSEFLDFDFSLSLSDGDVSNFFQNEQTRSFLADRALAGDGLAGYRAGLAPGIFDNAIYPQSRGLLETAGSYLYNGAQVVGGVTKYLGDTITGGIEGFFNDIPGALRGVNSALEGIVDTAYAGTIDVFARQFGLGNGAFERTAARFDSLINGALGGIGSFEDSIAYNFETGNYVGLGENLGAGLLFGATLASPKNLSGFGSTSKMTSADWTMVNADRVATTSTPIGDIVGPYIELGSNEAIAAKRVYNQSFNSQESLVIGRLDDTAAGAEIGLRRLNEPDWTVNVNDAWVQGGIDAAKPFYLGSNISFNNLRSGNPIFPKTIFFRELSQLRDAGYYRQGDWVLPPKQQGQ